MTPVMTKSFKAALSRTSRPIPGVKDSRFPSSSSTPRFAGKNNKNNNNSTDKAKTTPVSSSYKSSFKSKPSGSNPFNLKVNKPKFEVLNRTDRGSRGNSVNSRTRAQAIRSATILPQLDEKNRAHTSTFIDRRFGIKDATLSREEVMQERFAREQQRIAKKQTRKQKFDLNSHAGEEEEEDDDDNIENLSLTHGGRSINKMEDDELENYDEEFDLDEEESAGAYNARAGNGQLDRDLVSAGHFGGFERKNNNTTNGTEVFDEKKSKQDVMKELIAKSKFYKLERQKIKEENEAMCEDVNEAFDSIRSNLQVLKEEDRKRIREESNTNTSSTSTTNAVVAIEDDYETVLKELAFDPRSKPSDRTLTPEEREEKDKKRTEEQQKSLLERMTPDDEIRSKSKNDEKEDGEEGDENEMEMDPELKRIAERQFKLMREFCHTGAEETYLKLVEYATKQPRTMIQLARAIRGDLGKLSGSFTERCNTNGRGVVMPGMGPIRLILLVSRLFSCSDYHHTVATPTQLLLAYYLGTGRMVKLIHVQRALALVYCTLQFQGVGKRCVPEALEVLFTILKVTSVDGENQNVNASVSASVSANISVSVSVSVSTSVSAASHYFTRPMSKSLIEELKTVVKANNNYNYKTTKNFNYSRLFNETLNASELFEFARELMKENFKILEEGSYPALKESARPFSILLPRDENLGRLVSSGEGGGVKKKSLQLQSHKPMSLPLLTPDFATDYSMEHRKRSGPPDELALSRMKRAHKREYKGAVRELKRDGAFLAAHKFKENRRKDSEYKNKINRIIGSIGNGN